MAEQDGTGRDRQSQRLTPIDRDADLYPWRRAHGLTWCFLYWIPVASFPVPTSQRHWLMIFLDRISSLLATQFDLRSEVFLQYKVLYPNLMKIFVNSAVDFGPLPGLGRKPGSQIPPPITEQDIQDMMDGKKYDFNEWVADYSYWFVNKSAKKQRELFLGYGGMTTIFLKADPKTKPPVIPFSPAIRNYFPIFQKFDVDGLVGHTFALMDGFQEKSKKLFGDGLEEEGQLRGIRFILPLLSTQHFFSQHEEAREKWFQLFDVYINESPADQGILLASKIDLEQHLIALTKRMREENLEYQERG
ncbi:MAG: hypothetical protein WAM79_06265 [Candidatus Sulfotelmatobacter sp.]